MCRSADVEYKRTIGALFAIYWLMRLDEGSDTHLRGDMAFCFGVDSQWQPPTPEQAAAVPSSILPNSDKRRKALRHIQWRHVLELFVDAGLLFRDDVDGSLRVNPERTAAMLALTAVHDIMKVAELLPTVLEAHGEYHGYGAGKLLSLS